MTYHRPTTATVEGQRRQLDQRIAALISSNMVAGLADVPSARLLSHVTAQSLISNQGGKRLRGLLTLTAGAALDPTLDTKSDQFIARPATVPSPAGPTAGPTSSTDQSRQTALLDLACAVEVFQTGALVHDDIIDDSDLRRGLPAAHKALAGLFKDFSSGSPIAESAAQATGTGLGIMLGDLLATQSLLIVSQAGEGVPDQAAALTSAFLRLQRDVEIGQVMDLADTAVRLDQPETMVENCLTVFRWKTASYTTIGPIELGFLTAGLAADQARLWAERIGGPLGVAFQLADDLIDIGQPSRPSGKPIGGDIKEGKHTVLLADSLLAAGPVDRARLTELYSQPSRDQADIEQVIAILARSGAVKRSQARIKGLWEQTQQQLTDWAAAYRVPLERAQELTGYCRLFLPGLTD